MTKNGPKLPAKMGNLDLWVLYHRIAMTLIPAKCLVEIEPISKKILPAQKNFLPP